MNACFLGKVEFYFGEASTGVPVGRFASLYAPSIETFCEILQLSKNLSGCDGRGYYLAHIACAPESTASVSHLKALFEARANFDLHSASRSG